MMLYPFYTFQFNFPMKFNFQFQFKIKVGIDIIRRYLRCSVYISFIVLHKFGVSSIRPSMNVEEARDVSDKG